MGRGQLDTTASHRVRDCVCALLAAKKEQRNRTRETSPTSAETQTNTWLQRHVRKHTHTQRHHRVSPFRRVSGQVPCVATIGSREHPWVSPARSSIGDKLVQASGVGHFAFTPLGKAIDHGTEGRLHWTLLQALSHPAPCTSIDHGATRTTDVSQRTPLHAIWRCTRAKTHEEAARGGIPLPLGTEVHRGADQRGTSHKTPRHAVTTKQQHVYLHLNFHVHLHAIYMYINIDIYIYIYIHIYIYIYIYIYM